jgi:hypothetical protein
VADSDPLPWSAPRQAPERTALDKNERPSTYAPTVWSTPLWHSIDAPNAVGSQVQNSRRTDLGRSTYLPSVRDSPRTSHPSPRTTARHRQGAGELPCLACAWGADRNRHGPMPWRDRQLRPPHRPPAAAGEAPRAWPSAAGEQARRADHPSRMNPTGRHATRASPNRSIGQRPIRLVDRSVPGPPQALLGVASRRARRSPCSRWTSEMSSSLV